MNNQKGFANIVLIVLVIVFLGVGGYFIWSEYGPQPCAQSLLPAEAVNKKTGEKKIFKYPCAVPRGWIITDYHPATLPKPQLTYPDVKAFLGSKATLNGELKLDLEGDGVTEVAFAYATALNQDNNDFSTGVRILKYTDSDGWKVAFEDTDRVGNGGGAKGAVGIEKVSGPNNKEAVLVVLTESGAGTATRWHLIASANGKISKLDPSSIRQKVLNDRGYQDLGYNGVKSIGNFVVETLLGYSKDTARCCPDKPSIEIKFRFAGNSIELDFVKELEFKTQN